MTTSRHNVRTMRPLSSECLNYHICDTWMDDRWSDLAGSGSGGSCSSTVGRLQMPPCGPADQTSADLVLA